MTVQIDVKRTGFPVRIGSLEIWFDSSLENLRSFFKAEQIANEKLKKAREQAKHIHFPKGIKNYSIEEFSEKDKEKIDAGFDVKSEFIAAQYDIIFGDGTFKKIYKEYKDILALELALEPLAKAIEKKIEELYDERLGKIEKEYLENIKNRN